MQNKSHSHIFNIVSLIFRNTHHAAKYCPILVGVLCRLKASTIKFCVGSSVVYGESSDDVNVDTVIHISDDKESDEEFYILYFNTLNIPSTFISPVGAIDQLHMNLDLLLRLVNVK